MIHPQTKPLNLNQRFTLLVRKGEAKIRKFAELHKLPIVEIEGLIRPILGSGLWDPIPHLIGVDHDRDDFDLDDSVGFGHLIGPDERSTSIAADWLASLDWNDKSHRDWIDTFSIVHSQPFRAGALIVAADLLQIQIRHFDFCMISVELLLPSTEFNRAKKRFFLKSK